MRIITIRALDMCDSFIHNASRQGFFVKVTVFVNGEGHVGCHNLIIADLAELEGAVSIHCLHLQDAVVFLSLKNGGFVGLLLEHWGVLVDVIHLNVDSRPEGNTQLFLC